MKKSISLLSMLIFPYLAFAQIGINTSNPQGILHVDGAKDNSQKDPPTSSQMLNDFIVTKTGNTGIGTTSPSEKLDIDGNARFRQVPSLNEKTSFFTLGVDDMGRLLKDLSISSYSTYLGFSPMANSHTDTLPFVIENGYITKITGTSIGACAGVMVDFTIQFIGTTYLGATLQARDTQESTVYSPVILSKNQSVFGKSLEVLANASNCDPTYGHMLTFSNGKITDTFLDIPTYYPNAGLFTIYSVNKVKQSN